MNKWYEDTSYEIADIICEEVTLLYKNETYAITVWDDGGYGKHHTLFYRDGKEYSKKEAEEAKII